VPRSFATTPESRSSRRDLRQRLQVIGAGMLRRQQHEHEIDRLAIDESKSTGEPSLAKRP
jgi:hypothetical protein